MGRPAVRDSAVELWDGSPPTTEREAFRVSYYDDEGDPLDVDNMIKPIQDALNLLVYIDDAQITDTSGHRRDINSSYRVRDISSVLAEVFVAGHEFIHVAIELDPDQEELP